MNTQQFLEQRKSGIGGSDVAAIFGLSKYKTALDVFLDKTEEKVEEDEEQNDSLYFGKLLEPIIINEYARRSGDKVSVENTFIVSKKYPWMLANIDAWIENKPLILEAKTARSFTNCWGDAETDCIPNTYILQCAHYCIVANDYRDIDGVTIAALGNTNDFRIYHYVRDLELEDIIIKKTRDFWYNNVLQKIMPTAATIEDISKKYPTALQGKEVIANENILNKLLALDSLRKEIKNYRGNLKKLEQESDELEVLLKDFIGEAESIKDNSGNLIATCKNSTRKSFSSLDLKEEFPEIYTKFSRVLHKRNLEITL